MESGRGRPYLERLCSSGVCDGTILECQIKLNAEKDMESKKKILLVEDDPTMRSTLGMFLESGGYEVLEARSAEDAVKELSSQGVDLVVTDLRMPGQDGIWLLKHIRKEIPDTNVILISAFGDIEIAVQALKEGAADFIEKPFTPPVFLERVAAAFTFKPKPEGEGVRQEKNRDFKFDHLVGRSPTVRKMKELVRMVHDLPDALLLSGEAGVGKESLARRVHEVSSRSGKPFIVVDCAALNDEALEKELFGKGDTRGVLEEGRGGTLFLDEIGSLSPAMQVKILNMLETRKVRLSGSAQEQNVDLLVVGSTSRDLESMVEQGNFRQDLFYNINVVHLRLEPLRERLEDIPMMMEYFLEAFNRASGKAIQGFGKSVFEMFMKYDWPGNVRELKSAVERSVVFCKEDVIQVQHVPDTVRNPRPRSASGGYGGVMTLKDMERAKIVETLKLHHGNKANTAKVLGIGRNTLWRKLKEYEIEEEEYKSQSGA